MRLVACYPALVGGGDAAVARGVRADRGYGMGPVSPFPCLVTRPNDLN